MKYLIGKRCSLFPDNGDGAPDEEYEKVPGVFPKGKCGTSGQNARGEDMILSFLLDDSGHAVEIHPDVPSDRPKLGDIYVGRVDKVAWNIHAAFVEIQPGLMGYLPLDELAEPVYTKKGPKDEIQAGDELAVQITREAFGEKDVSLTARLEMKGVFSVLTLGGEGLGISKKIPPEEKERLKVSVGEDPLFLELLKKAGRCGVVLRTNAQGADTGMILRELERLQAELLNLKLTAPYRTAHSALFRQPPRWLARAGSLVQEDVQEILTEDKELYDLLRAYFQGNAKVQKKLRFYQDSFLPLSKLCSLERELSRALRKKVDLKSGADLVIERTEALYVIDVNSGRSQAGKKGKEEYTLQVNLEAARECARQIRLRNLSGIIVIDFINLLDQNNSKKVIEELRRASGHDPMRVQVIEMTRLGLVELTRKKVELPLDNFF